MFGHDASAVRQLSLYFAAPNPLALVCAAAVAVRHCAHSRVFVKTSHQDVLRVLFVVSEGCAQLEFLVC